MIPALKKQMDQAKVRTTGILQLPYSESFALSAGNASWLSKSSSSVGSRPPRLQQDVSASRAASGKPKGRRGGDPVGGPHRSWYGNYTGPGNERGDWEDEHLPAMTPLDRGPMQHDQEYSNLEEQYGYGKGSFWKMRLDTEHPFLHTSLMESDARLMWRSAWYPLEGLANGEYDLTFNKGSQGVTNLLTDSLAAGVIHGVFPVLIGIDAAVVGIAAIRNVQEGILAGIGRAGSAMPSFEVGRSVASSPYWSPEIPDEWSRTLWVWQKKLEAEFWAYKPFPNATTGWKGDFFGYGYWEIGMRDTTMLDIAIFAISFAAGPAGPASWIARGGISWAAVAAYGAATLAATAIGDLLERGFEGAAIMGSLDAMAGKSLFSLKRNGLEFSRYCGAIGTSAATGWKRGGGTVSSEWKRAGGRASDAWKQAGSDISTGWKSAGDKIGDAWEQATGGGGGCFLTTAAVRSLSVETGDRVLSTLRTFRDDFLLASDLGRELVGVYYAIAPRIVNRIDASIGSAAEYDEIYREIILPCYQYILKGDSEAAVGIYWRGVCKLAGKWLSCDLQRLPSSTERVSSIPDSSEAGPNGSE